MIGESPQRNAGEGFTFQYASSKAWRFSFRSSCTTHRLTEGCVVTQHRITDAGKLGQFADRLVVIRSMLQLSGPASYASEFNAPWVSSMRRYRSPYLLMRPRCRVLPEEYSLDVSPDRRRSEREGPA